MQGRNVSKHGQLWTKQPEQILPVAESKLQETKMALHAWSFVYTQGITSVFVGVAIAVFTH